MNHQKSRSSSALIRISWGKIWRWGRRRCCLELGLRIGLTFLDFSFVVGFQRWCSEGSCFWAVIIWLGSWCRWRMPIFRRLVLWLRCWHRWTWELWVVLWCFEWRLVQESNLFHRWVLLIILLSFLLNRTCHQGWRYWFPWVFGCSPILLWLVHSWYRRYFWSTRCRSRCWTCWLAVGRWECPACISDWLDSLLGCGRWVWLFWGLHIPVNFWAGRCCGRSWRARWIFFNDFRREKGDGCWHCRAQACWASRQHLFCSWRGLILIWFFLFLLCWCWVCFSWDRTVFLFAIIPQGS